MDFTQEHKRKAFNSLLSKILVDTEKHTYSVTSVFDKMSNGYDFLATQYDKNHAISKRMFFEGVCTDSYSALFIDEKTFKLLKFIINEPVDNIYYVNFTPRNTFIFDLLKLESDGKLLFNDGFSYLDNTDATVIKFSYSPSGLLDDINEDEFNIENEYPVDLKNYKRDENGDLIFDTLEEFTSSPYHIKKRHLMERYVKMNLLPGEDKQDMLEKHETIEKLYLFLKERTRNKFLAKY